MPETRNDEAAHRYEIVEDGVVAGFAEYMAVRGERIVFTHTEVDRKFEGRGVGAALVRTSLDDVRAEGKRKVLPLSPFYKGWIGRHREYVPIVYGVPESTATD